MQVVVGEIARRERRHIGAPDDDRSGLLPVRDRRAVGRRDHVLERDHSIGRGAAGIVHVDLDRDRNAVQDAEVVTAAQGFVRAVGGGERLVGKIIDDRIEAWIDGLDPLEAAADRLAT